MKLGRSWGRAAALATAGIALLTACGRRQAPEANDITASFSVSRPSAPLGTPIEITYTWTVGPAAKKVDGDYRALVHFLDSKSMMLFEDDHIPSPAPSTWEPGKTYSYTRTRFIPIYPYSGEVEVRMGLYRPTGRGERVALKGEDTGMLEYRVGSLRLLPQTENTLFLVQKEGWHTPETTPQNPGQERQWTKKEASVNFKNPKKDVVIYLVADTNYKAFPQPPVLTVSVNGKAGLNVPIENSEVFTRKIRVKAADLGDAEWVDLRLVMNQSFVPKTVGVNQDERVLGLLVYNLFVGEEDKLGKLPTDGIVDATPLAAPAAVVPAKGPATKVPAAKPQAAKPAVTKAPTL